MQSSKCGYVALLMTLASACGGGSGTPTLPSTTILLSGQVTDRTTSTPVSGAIVRLNGWQVATTDSAGNYRSDAGSLAGQDGMTFVEANNYARDYRYVRGRRR